MDSFQEIHQSNGQRQQLSRSVEQLTSNVHLATSARSIYVFLISGIPQSNVYLPHSDEFIGYQFYIHAGHWMIEATRPNGNGVLQNVPWTVG